MDTSVKQSERHEFRAFLRQHHYEPQGRLSRVGTLEEKDMDAILRGRLLPVWQWVFRNVKNGDDMEVIRRNVRVARHQIESSKQEREDAKQHHDALESRKKHLLESVVRAKARERQLLHSLRTLENEDAAVMEKAVESKQREVLRHAYNAKQDETFALLTDKLSQLMEKVTVDDAMRMKLQSSAAAMKNPIAVLLREYLRMLKAGDAEIVDFGDSDVAHLRNFGGSVLTQWLSELAAATQENGESDSAMSFTDQEEAEYAAHVAENTSSSRDALTQVQQLLQKNQREHIARFLETQTLYAKAQQTRARVRDLHQQESESSKDYDLWGENYDSSNAPRAQQTQINEPSSITTADPKQLVADTVRLEVENKAQRAAFDVAKQTYETLVQQIQSSRQQKVDLDQKLELMRSFEQRQQEILDQLDAMYHQNQEIVHAVITKQEQLNHFVSEQLQSQYASKSGVLMETWWKLVMEELRSVSSAGSLAKLDTAVKSVELTLDEYRHSGMATSNRQVSMAVPFPEFYINQIQLERSESSSNGGGGGGSSSLRPNAGGGLANVLNALQVPSYGSWAKLLTLLQQRDYHNEVAGQMLSEQLARLELQLQEDRQQQIRPHQQQQYPHNPFQVQALLPEIRNAMEELQAAAFPALEEIAQANAETLANALVRLKAAIDDWFEQSGFNVHLKEADS